MEKLQSGVTEFSWFMKLINLLQLQKTQYLQLGQSRGQYYGGSLPNVNQIGNSAMDLPFQHNGALAEAFGAVPVSLVNKFLGFLLECKCCCLNVAHVDSCPYGTVYLSPPSDTSWRRTNSDSALHQSTMTPAQQESFSGGSQDMQQKRVLLLTVPGMEEPTSDADKTLSKQGWDTKKTGSSRPKSCEVPGINIFPSAEQENTTALIPGTHNTGGSLPDLTNIHFPSPLPTPLDPEESSFPALSSSSSTGNLAANLTHLGISTASQGMTTTPAPSQHRQPSVSPLSLGTDSRRPQSQQMSPTLSPLSPITQASLQQYRSNAGSPANQSPTSPVSNQGFSPGSSPQHSSMLGSVFGDSYYEQQMTARQANALSHQLEQFNMIENAISSNSLYSPCSTLNYSQAAMMGLTGSHGSLQDSQQLNYSSHSNIPNIILTGFELGKRLETPSGQEGSRKAPPPPQIPTLAVFFGRNPKTSAFIPRSNGPPVTVMAM
ncbi:hypothetical protein EK904_004806 [Melospiza melodia maxima]|nr:hypothetical protein EK904_004806 [Melospiza melodia maxima]